MELPLYLVDTNIISVNTPVRRVAPASLVQWMDRNSDRLYLSVITIAEIEDGIAKARRMGAVKKVVLLTEWLELLLHLYTSRILAFDVTAARIAGVLSDLARGMGLAPGFQDLAIAAIAQAHGLTVLTRNLKHFAPLGVAVSDPFAAIPE